MISDTAACAELAASSWDVMQQKATAYESVLMREHSTALEELLAAEMGDFHAPGVDAGVRLHGGAGGSGEGGEEDGEVTYDGPKDDIDRLALTGAVAAPLRRMVVEFVDGKAVPKAPRKLKTYDPKTGKTTGYTTNVKLVEGLVKAQALEIAVEEGVRPKEIVCKDCGVLVKVPKNTVPERCRRCAAENAKARMAKYRAENPEKVKAGKAKYRAENPEKVKAGKAKYQAENPENAKTRSKRWRAKNPEKVKARMAKYRAENPEKVKAYTAKYRAAKKAAT